MKKTIFEGKPYNPKTTETEIYKSWEKSGYFNPDKLTKNNGKNYISYMPLPNVTGSLHMGHALNNAMQDILVRYHRIRGYRTLWLPGMDHAGISTQYVVEKKLKKEGSSRFKLGREKFIEKVWEWKKEYGGLITGQLKSLGISADWSRERFTMDTEYARDVIKTFIHYHEKGLIYRGLRTVNWCPRCNTSLSELELEYEEEEGMLYYIKYGPFELATVRPETKFGDTALAVNPKDPRYKNYIGEEIEIDSLSTDGELDKPKIKKIKIKVVGDEAVDIEFGTGVVKVTPGHDLTDFEIGVRHNLPIIQVIDELGKMNEKAGKYSGMKTKDAREKIVSDLEAVYLLTKKEPYTHRVSKCYRCNHIIEPIPSKQWFLKMKDLASGALHAVENGKVKIHPENFEKTYTNWLLNIRDWTISRQIWWGHRLPVYFCKNEKDQYIVSESKPKKCLICKNCEMEQAPDVLDTWFSSALWPFAGFSKEDAKKYYPGDILITARDIINLWVSRMIFSGIEFKNEVPFKDVLIHGTILTKDGKRMSKSLGTGIDPLKYIENYGADATRFAVIWQATGQDIRWDESAVSAGKKFNNKLWNASRFVLTKTNDSANWRTTDDGKKIISKTVADEKILSSLCKIKKETEKYIENFEFSAALKGLYDFFWHDFCDVYLEDSKKQLDDKNLEKNTSEILNAVLLESLILLHPFIPFITEEIYGHLPEKRSEFLMIHKID